MLSFRSCLFVSARSHFEILSQEKINEAIKNQLDKLDFASSFNTSHELPFEFSRKIIELLPGRNFGQVFFTMCGSTAVDTAMKIALAYHRANGESGRVRFVGRERGYHGVGFGGNAADTQTLEYRHFLYQRVSFILT